MCDGPILTFRPQSRSLQHIEFFHRDHFQYNYHRSPATNGLSVFVDFFWQTDFNHLWADNPNGFSDVLFSNTGYTYLINLGTPFVMQVGEKKFEMRTDGFLPRHKTLECFHTTGNCLFGIKFRVSPVKIIRNINFAEYKEYIFPLTYLIDQKVIEKIKKVDSFNERVQILSEYFHSIIDSNKRVEQPVKIVTAIMNDCDTNNDFTTPIEDIAAKYGISSRTLQRYFETCTGIGTKQALQVLRIRKATDHLVNSPEDFHFSRYGYYDHSHFSKHLRLFLQKDAGPRMNLHVKLLQQLH